MVMDLEDIYCKAIAVLLKIFNGKLQNLKFIYVAFRFEELEVEDLEESTKKFNETLHDCAFAVAGKTVKQKEQQLQPATKSF